MIPLPLLIVLLLLLTPTAEAAAQGASGYAEVKGFSYFERRTSDDPLFAGWGTLFSKWEAPVGPAQFTGSLRAEGITSDERGDIAFDPADRRLRRSPFSVQDLWLRIPLSSSLDMQMGRFQLGWGKTDGYSPADAFLPRDLSDPFADEKIPLWSLRLVGQTGNIRYDGVYSPVTTPWRLPILGSRNAPLALDAFPAGTTFAESEPNPPNAGFAALRVLGTFGDWDLGAWGRFGVRPAPVLDIAGDEAKVGPSGIVVPVRRRFAHEEAVGLEASRILGSWVIRGEGALLLSRDREIGNAIITSLSAEKGFGDGTLLVTLAANLLDPPVDEALLFDRAMLPLLIVAWNKTEEWGDWKIVHSSGLKEWDGLLKAEVGYNVTDLWKVTGGVDIPYGPDDGPFGALHAAKRVRLALRYSW